jgi:hypothetical protein
MLKRSLVVLVAVASFSPLALAAQGLGLGGRVGTLGLGGELAIGLTDRVVARGGIGFTPFEPTMTFGDLDVSLTIPSVWNVGLDLYLNGAMRIGGGMMFRTSDPEVTGEFNQPQEIGGTTFTPGQLGTLTGVFDSNNNAPYVLIGFGRHTADGLGLFIDFGVAFVGDPDVRLDATGGSLDPDTDPTLRNALDQEAAEFEDDVRGYLKFWPVLSIGFRLGAY